MLNTPALHAAHNCLLCILYYGRIRYYTIVYAYVPGLSFFAYLLYYVYYGECKKQN